MARKFELPLPPASQDGAVKAWREAVAIPTYNPMPADRNPMFLEKRVYQGSSGGVYPLPFTDRISSEPVERTWDALHLENEFLRLMVLPEIGGRIHVGLDKTNGYDFFYRQNVIKPALVGLAGPWVSGGVEFNWPQHHRPGTFVPVRTHIEEGVDGSRTIWCSDYDAMNRLKGMHGVCLHPGKALIELKVRLYNGTPFTQTFLWWANVATRVHERYQSFFSPDVHYITDHAKRAMSGFPLCNGYYYGVNYGARAKDGVPAEDAPRSFVPPGNYPANDLSWYANIPVPTSYMATGSSQDFFGGYDHAREAGVVHVANHHIAPGKKQWTWGNHEFGYAWDRHLTDEDGPYIELMAGVYTDNQPDFSFLAPGETRTFSQFWYPIQKIGPARAANLEAAISLLAAKGRARVGVCVATVFPQVEIELLHRGRRLAAWTGDCAPGAPFLKECTLPARSKAADLTVVVRTGDGRELIRYTPAGESKAAAEVPPPATEPAVPERMASNDELYLTGLHLEQYRHATRYPEDYWREALRRDPEDSRCNNAMGRWHLRRGEFAEAEVCFRRSVASATRRNPNPYDGEPYFNLGLALRYLGRDEEAYAAFYKATWNQAWQSAGYHAIAELDAGRGNWWAALDHLDRALRVNTDHSKARNLKAIVLRQLGRAEEADALLRHTLALDPLDAWARHLSGCRLECDNQTRLDIALDLTRAGLDSDAIDVLTAANFGATDGSVPLIWYTAGHLHARRLAASKAAECYARASRSRPDYCFPNRLEEIGILDAAMRSNPGDARAPYYLGNLLYGRRRHREAIALWETASRLDPTYSVAWRNLGIGYFNVLGDRTKARRAFDRALRAAPGDARILYERDQLWKRIGELPARRLVQLEKYPALTSLRDDLSIELATLYNQTGHHEKARAILESRHFQPWEGGEGQALEQYVRTYLGLGRLALKAGDASEAGRFFSRALTPPESLGEAKHLLANQSDIYYWLGVSSRETGDLAAAKRWWHKAATSRGDFQEMSLRSFSEMTYYNALALQALGKAVQAGKLLHDLLDFADGLLRTKADIDYFATSLPAMLLFEDDAQYRRTVTARFLQAQARLALGQVSRARQRLGQVLAMDGNHGRAADLLAEINAGGHHAR
jgi:tetratricopeptide (TPR) repeat protein